MGHRYTITRNNVVLSTTADVFAIIPAAARSFKILEVTIHGMGTASAANDIALTRISAAGTGAPTAITPSPLHPNAPAAALTVAHTYATTQPTLAGAVVDRYSVNANGGIMRKVYPPGSEPEVIGGALGIALRSTSGTSNVTVSVIVEEI